MRFHISFFLVWGGGVERILIAFLKHQETNCFFVCLIVFPFIKQRKDKYIICLCQLYLIITCFLFVLYVQPLNQTVVLNKVELAVKLNYTYCLRINQVWILKKTICLKPLHSISVLRIIYSLLIACDKGLYGVECNETCGYCREINHCFHIDGRCLTGCNESYLGELCKIRRGTVLAISYQQKYCFILLLLISCYFSQTEMVNKKQFLYF